MEYNIQVVNIFDNVKLDDSKTFVLYKDLTNTGLIMLIQSYDNYVQKIVGDKKIEYDPPVDMHRYLNNEFKEELTNNKDTYIKKNSNLII